MRNSRLLDLYTEMTLGRCFALIVRNSGKFLSSTCSQARWRCVYTTELRGCPSSAGNGDHFVSCQTCDVQKPARFSDCFRTMIVFLGQVSNLCLYRLYGARNRCRGMTSEYGVSTPSRVCSPVHCHPAL